ncbi:MAG: N-acetyltransferase [Clostridiales Family XIII bacterium]|jgi:predicted GNAT family acetyltransferase|nr:N-acetyltransferase [Clostridiales Family XIII bacterium]
MEYKRDTNWIYATDTSGNVIAEITFPNIGEGVVAINHTFVDESLRGQGIAAELVREAYDAIKAAGKKAVLICPYAVKWFKEHPERNDVVTE